MAKESKLRKRQHLLMQIEQGIKVANRKVIDELIPPVTVESVMPLAISVARLRARYLAAAYQFAEKEHGDALNEAEVASLSRHQEMYEAARDAFEALNIAIERGYIKVG